MRKHPGRSGERPPHAARPAIPRRWARRGWACALLAACLCPRPAPGAGCTPLRLEEIFATLVPALHSFRLDNGLRVHLVPRESEQTVSVRVGYDVGARDEPAGRDGVAHLFEHMMFKGSRHVPDGGHFRLVRDVGGRVNAETSYDTTEYWNTVPATHLERVLAAEADRMREIRLSRANLDNQRAAIQEEGLRLENVPYVAAAADFLVRAWAETPYGHSPIGSDETLRAMTEEEAIAFHRAYYTPANAVLVVVGALDVAATRHIVERYFGDLPGDSPRPARIDFEVDRTGRAEVVEDPLAPFPVYAIVWHGVGERHPDWHALAVLDDLLLGQASARLARSIRGPLAFDAYSLSFSLRDAGLLNFAFAPRTFASFADVREVVSRESESLRREGPAPDELCRSIQHEQLERLDRMQTNEGLAAAIARGTLFHDEPLRFEDDLRALSRLDREAIRRSAERYLVDDPLSLEIAPAGIMRWLKPVLEILPAGVGASLEGWLL